MDRHPCIKHWSELQGKEPRYYSGSQEPLSIGCALGHYFGFARIGIHHEIVELDIAPVGLTRKKRKMNLCMYCKAHQMSGWMASSIDYSRATQLASMRGWSRTYLYQQYRPDRPLVVYRRHRTRR